jgi:hypothetical protein
MNQMIAKTLSLLFVVAAAVGPAAASEWWYVAHDPNRVLFVDQQSIRREGPVVRYWTLIALHDAAHPAGETKAYMRADCSTQEIGWLATADYDRKDAQGDVSTRPERDVKMARPERETLDQAQLSFVCNAGYRVVNHLFPITIDEVAFAQAVIRAGSALADPRALHATMAKDPAVPVIRSIAPDTATFGQVQTARLGEPLVPPRDYHKSEDVPRPADYDPDTTGVIYDVAYGGLEGGDIRFEVRGYSGDDMVHPGSGQTAGTPEVSKSIQIRDLSISIVKATAEAIVYRVTIVREQPVPVDECVNETCGEATVGPDTAPPAAKRSRRGQ